MRLQIADRGCAAWCDGFVSVVIFKRLVGVDAGTPAITNVHVE